MTLCACAGEALDFGAECCALPAHDGPAGIGRFPSSRLRLMTEVHAGLARVRAEARQGLALERRLGGEDACHRSDDGEPTAHPCQRNFGATAAGTSLAAAMASSTAGILQQHHDSLVAAIVADIGNGSLRLLRLGSAAACMQAATQSFAGCRSDAPQILRRATRTDTTRADGSSCRLADCIPIR